MAADMSDGHASPPVSQGRLRGNLPVDLGGGIGKRETTGWLSRACGRLGRADIQRQHVRDGPARVLLDEGIVPLWQQATVESVSELCNPDVMKVVEDPRVHSGPVVHRHPVGLQWSN